MDLDNLSPRRATPADAPALNALARAAYAVYVPAIGREPMPMAVDWATLLSVKEIWILDGPSGEAVASLALEVEPDHLVIWSVAVAPAHQGRGLGRSLMAFAETRARALQRSEIRLFTNARMGGNIVRYAGSATPRPTAKSAATASSSTCARPLRPRGSLVIASILNRHPRRKRGSRASDGPVVLDSCFRGNDGSERDDAVRYAAFARTQKRQVALSWI